jgi:plastocyanin
MVAIRKLWTAPSAPAAERSIEQAEKAAGVMPYVQMGVLAGILALAAMAPASAQVGLLNGPGLWDYTGVLTPYGYFPPRYPSTWITPNYVFDYSVPLYAPPRVVYVPVPTPVAPQAPAVAPAQVVTITLRRGALPADVRVKPGTVVVWRNGGNADATLVFPQPRQAGTGGQVAAQRWPVRAKSSFSLAFNQPGTYDYYESQAPGYQAHVIVTP